MSTLAIAAKAAVLIERHRPGSPCILVEYERQPGWSMCMIDVFIPCTLGRLHDDEEAPENARTIES